MMKMSASDETCDIGAIERVCAQVQDLYDVRTNGLLDIAHVLHEHIEAPRSKVSVMIVGNHSAGKSSFINWYIGENVQNESVAMETSSFTFITNGKKRETFKGRATIKHKPFLSGIEKFHGSVANLCTEVSASRKNLFSMCDFVDTPGLTDGSLKYPYPVNEILEWLGEKVDLIFVCFDPHGQALCERTMKVVQKLSDSCKSKLHYFLTMADKIPSEKERSKVILQMAQSLSHSHSRKAQGEDETWLGEHALRVRPIFLPEKAVNRVSEDDDFNRIDEVIVLIRDTVNQHVQNHIERLEDDAKRLLATTRTEIQTFERRSRVNRCLSFIRTLLFVVAWTIPTVLMFYLAHFVESVFVPKEWLQSAHLQSVFDIVHSVSAIFALVDSSRDRYRVLGFLCLIFLVFIFMAKLFGKCFLKVKAPKDAKNLFLWRNDLSDTIDKKVPEIWKLYFSDSTYDTK